MQEARRSLGRRAFQFLDIASGWIAALESGAKGVHALGRGAMGEAVRDDRTLGLPL